MKTRRRAPPPLFSRASRICEPLLPLPACGERGLCAHLSVKVGTLSYARRVERPPHPARKSAPTSPRKRGEVLGRRYRSNAASIGTR
jgi:hypothetical protein